MVNAFKSISIKEVKGVFLDLDDTLYSYQRVHPKALLSSFNMMDFGIDFNMFSQKYRDHRKAVTQRLYPQGSCRSRLIAFQGLTEELNIKDPYWVALKLTEKYWETFYQTIRPSNGVVDFIDSCRNQQIQIVVVSDMLLEVQIKKLKALGLLNKIDYIVTSEEVGVEKPNMEIFKRALKKSNLDAKNVIMIGDSKEKDIEGAEALGIKSYLVTLDDQ